MTQLRPRRVPVVREPPPPPPPPPPSSLSRPHNGEFISEKKEEKKRERDTVCSPWRKQSGKLLLAVPFNSRYVPTQRGEKREDRSREGWFTRSERASGGILRVVDFEISRDVVRFFFPIFFSFFFFFFLSNRRVAILI